MRSPVAWRLNAANINYRPWLSRKNCLAQQGTVERLEKLEIAQAPTQNILRFNESQTLKFFFTIPLKICVKWVKTFSD